MDRSIRNDQLVEQVFESYRIIFKELKDKISSSHHKAFAKKRKTPENRKTLLGRGIICGFSLFVGGPGA
jgi:hypothetical protein